MGAQLAKTKTATLGGQGPGTDEAWLGTASGRSLDRSTPPGLKTPEHHLVLMPKRDPSLSPSIGGVAPSDMSNAPPRAKEVLGSRSKAAPEHEHLGKESTPHGPPCRRTWPTENSRKAVGHELQRKGRTVEEPEPPKAPTFSTSHPKPPISQGGASKEETTQQRVDAAQSARILDFRPGDGSGVGSRRTSATPPRREIGSQGRRRGWAVPASLGFPQVASYPPAPTRFQHKQPGRPRLEPAGERRMNGREHEPQI